MAEGDKSTVGLVLSQREHGSALTKVCVMSMQLDLADKDEAKGESLDI